MAAAQHQERLEIHVQRLPRFLFAVAALLSVSTATAVPLNLSAADGIAGTYVDGLNLYVIGIDGRTWVLSAANLTGWLPTTYPGLPEGVRIADVADWNARFLATNSGARWQYNVDPAVMGWVRVPPLPSAPVPALGQSLGAVKGLFR